MCFLRFFFMVVISFSLHAMLPLLANKNEYVSGALQILTTIVTTRNLSFRSAVSADNRADITPSSDVVSAGDLFPAGHVRNIRSGARRPRSKRRWPASGVRRLRDITRGRLRAAINAATNCLPRRPLDTSPGRPAGLACHDDSVTSYPSAAALRCYRFCHFNVRLEFFGRRSVLLLY